MGSGNGPTEGEIRAERSCICALRAERDLRLERSMALAVVAQGNVEITNGGCNQLVAGGDVSFRNGGCALVIAPKVSVEEGGRVLMTVPQALAFGAAMGIVCGLTRRCRR